MVVVQVRLAGGGRLVVKLNAHHTVLELKKAVMAAQPEDAGMEFSLVSLGPPSRTLQNGDIMGDQKLLGSAVIQRLA